MLHSAATTRRNAPHGDRLVRPVIAEPDAVIAGHVPARIMHIGAPDIAVAGVPRAADLIVGIILDLDRVRAQRLGADIVQKIIGIAACAPRPRRGGEPTQTVIGEGPVLTRHRMVGDVAGSRHSNDGERPHNSNNLIFLVDHENGAVIAELALSKWRNRLSP